MKKLLFLPLLLLASCSCPPEIAEVRAGATCVVRETCARGEPGRSSFTLNEADAGKLNAWFRENRSRFSSSYRTFAPHRRVLVIWAGGRSLSLALTQDGKALVLALVRKYSRALQDQYVLSLEEEDAEILQLLRLED